MAYDPSSSLARKFLVVVVLLSVCAPSFFNGVLARKQVGLFARLIHRDSVQSPYYNPNRSNTYGQATRELEQSIARVVYLQSKSRSTALPSVEPNDYRAEVIGEDHGVTLIANISFGNPPVPQLVAMDSGSSLLWIQCLPCKTCYHQRTPIFNPSKSADYSILACESDRCPKSYMFGCDTQSINCTYEYGYIDGFRSSGNIATDQLTFVTSDEGIVSVPNVVMGCGHENKGRNGQLSGILGLGPEGFSLVSQLGNKFSYCLGNLNDPTYSYNNLIIGEGAILEGDPTPLEIDKGNYYVTLEGISIGGKALEFYRGIFTRYRGKGGVMFDSGASVTFLSTSAYETFELEINGMLEEKLERVPKDRPNQSQLCYKGVIERDLIGFPVVTFHFAGGAELGLLTESLFVENGVDEFCMTIQEIPAVDKDLSVIGGRAQQNYNVGYDIAGKQLYLQCIDCALFES